MDTYTIVKTQHLRGNERLFQLQDNMTEQLVAQAWLPEDSTNEKVEKYFRDEGFLPTGIEPLHTSANI